MSPEDGFPDERLFERLARALQVPDVEPSAEELARLHAALDGALQTDGVDRPHLDPAEGPTALAPAIHRPRPDPPGRLEAALDTLSTCLDRHDVDEIPHAVTELRAELAQGGAPRGALGRRARKLLGEAARLLLTHPPTEPRGFTG